MEQVKNLIENIDDEHLLVHLQSLITKKLHDIKCHQITEKIRKTPLYINYNITCTNSEYSRTDYHVVTSTTFSIDSKLTVSFGYNGDNEGSGIYGFSVNGEYCWTDDFDIDTFNSMLSEADKILKILNILDPKEFLFSLVSESYLLEFNELLS